MEDLLKKIIEKKDPGRLTRAWVKTENERIDQGVE